MNGGDFVFSAGDRMPLKGKKIFVVEYSAFISAQIKGVLVNAGAEVRSNPNPSKALLEIVHWHPDAIISNVDIGEITGFDLCLILKMMPEHASIPFIILSSEESEVIKKQMVSVGADFYVPKDSQIANNTYKTVCEALHESKEELLAKPVEARKQQGDAVLVVDDSGVMRRIICNILTSLGLKKIEQAAHGQEALEKLDQQSFGLVLTDWNMPFMNGLDLARAIRQRPDTQRLPIIMITTEGAKEERKMAMSAGVDELVSKPFTRDQFRKILEQFLK